MIKLYETQSYLKRCGAKITKSFEKDGRFYVRLDRSIFFPEEGGQYADTGFLIIKKDEAGGVPKTGTADPGTDKILLLDGQIEKAGNEKGEVTYEVSAPVEEGTLAECFLDWEKRYDRMQNHSGEHVLTGTVHNKYGLNNVGFHLSDDGFVTLDLDGMLTYEQMIEMERKANEAIYKNYPITDSYPNDDELSRTEYRSKIEIEGQVRLITIGNDDETVDVCACCAPHVHSTGEIGIIKVISVIKWKKGIQVSILCGRRALEYIEHEHDLITKISGSLSTSPENVPDMVKSHIDEITDLKHKLSQAQSEKIISDIALIGENDAKAVFTDTELDAVSMKNIYNELCAGFASCPVGIFVGDDEKGYRFNAGITDGDARELAQIFREKLGAKGGGSAEMVQGRVSASRAEISEIMQGLSSSVPI